MMRMFATLREKWLPHYYCGIAILGMLLQSLGSFILKIRHDAWYESLEYKFSGIMIFKLGENSFLYISIAILFSIILVLRYLTKSIIFYLTAGVLSGVAFTQYWILIRIKLSLLYPESGYFVWVVITLIADAAIIGCAFYGALKFPVRNSVKWKS